MQNHIWNELVFSVMRKFSHLCIHTDTLACEVCRCENIITNSENMSYSYNKQIMPPLPILNIYFNEPKKLLKLPVNSNEVLQLTHSEIK